MISHQLQNHQVTTFVARKAKSECEQLRILAFNRTNNTSREINRQLKLQLSPTDEITFVGKTDTNFVMSGLIRLKRRGQQVRHWWQSDYQGKTEELIYSNSYNEDLLMGVDHLQRRSEGFTWSYHNLSDFYDCNQYYHIVVDAISSFLISKRINLVLFFDIPHLFYDTITYQISKAKGIEMLILCDSVFENKFSSLTSIEDFGKLPQMHEEKYENKFPIESDEVPEWYYMRGVQQWRGELGKLTWRGLLILATHMIKNERQKLLYLSYWTQCINRMRRIAAGFPSWRYPFSRYFLPRHLAYFEELLKHEDSAIELNCKFVYFALHLQPEKSTSPLGGYYADQLLAIEKLAQIIPDDHQIYIKENPRQRGQMRGKQFFARLEQINKVRMLPSYANTNELIKRSQFVATITGTVGWEAIRTGKKVLYFGMPWYRDFEGAIAYYDGISHDDIFSFNIDHEKLERRAGQLVSRLHDGSVVDISAQTEGDKGLESNAELVVDSILRLIRGEVETTYINVN